MSCGTSRSSLKTNGSPRERVIPHLIPPKDAEAHGRVYELHEYLALTVTDSGP
jgi:hypothetical protein